MTLRRPVSCFALFFIISTGWVQAEERFQTENFLVTAPTKQLAKTFGEYAEVYRKEKAVEWLGHEIKPWPNRCPLNVVVRMDKNGGETTFTFGLSPGSPSMVLSQKMLIFGETNQLLVSVLPHEVTHTIFAQHFGEAVPRWADEGGSVYSENDEERYLHDVRCRQLLNKGQAIPLRVLFSLKNYPPDMHTLYAQGYSVVNFLVEKGGRKRFLDFVRRGMQNKNNNWEVAAREVYDYESVDDMQAEWIKTLEQTRPSRIAKNTNPKAPAAATLVSAARGQETRTSPGVPNLEAPVVARGVSPATERPGTPIAPPSVLPLPAPLKLGAPEMPIKK
jgi:hypothetical protein